MSRIGKKPIPIPAGVTIHVKKDIIEVKGPKGLLVQGARKPIEVKVEGSEVILTRPDDSKPTRALHGLLRALLNNMVTGVTKGFEKRLELQGVGYRATLEGKNLSMALGYSHPISIKPPEGITFEVSKKQTEISVKGIDKQLVGQLAADIRSLRPVEPYKGKGVRYEGERVIRKAGKSVASGK